MSKTLSDRQFAVLIFGLLIGAVGFYLSNSKITDFDFPATKPFGTFDEFYPFYLTQHENTTSRRLHITGTSIILLWSTIEPSILLSLALAAFVGYSACQASRPFDHAGYEVLLVLPTFLFSMNLCTNSWKKPLMVLVIGYGFAWFGHFFFELNKPAAFSYPTFSLLSDFRMWFETATLLRPF